MYIYTRMKKHMCISVLEPNLKIWAMGGWLPFDPIVTWHLKKTPQKYIEVFWYRGQRLPSAPLLLRVVWLQMRFSGHLLLLRRRRRRYRRSYRFVSRYRLPVRKERANQAHRDEPMNVSLLSRHSTKSLWSHQSLMENRPVFCLLQCEGWLSL